MSVRGRAGWMVVGLALFPAVAAACSCVVGNGCPGLGREGGPRFVGTVLAVVAGDGGAARTSWQWQKTRLRVDEVFGGMGEGQKEVEVWTSLGGCGFRFRVGTSYLVDATADLDGRLRTGTCSYTREVGVAGAMLQVLRRRRDGRKAASLTGRIVQEERNFLDDHGARVARTLGGTVVRVRSGESSFQTVADGDGVYAFYDLPRGKYTLAAELPGDVGLFEWLGSERPQRAIEVAGAACQLVDLSVTSRGSISGKLVDEAGRPVLGVQVAVAPVEQELLGRMRLYSARSDGKGEFRLIHIPPGEYVLVVNPDDDIRNGFAYRRTFYPGVPELARAGVVRVAAGEQVKGADIRLERMH